LGIAVDFKHVQFYQKIVKTGVNGEDLEKEPLIPACSCSAIAICMGKVFF